ncbi:MAG: hypothetical protein A3C88_01850 [Candidatus Yanofskybacteria bacterium RIFCSPHIGHO2_02_FULL_50_12]|uniref:Uncharacterized protein n=1 Tax=Candidatus Yanofskybacteria bacterium RIFCSPHIGHO2_02_FULL_50_12 TaxID=1802685 RepID=A0A1F8FWR9_9BACT|nr:MAG: hypothetical protein A3C88_01850 [Candidatus Yanofskybacteria bacterium RIFCSPHIGHO2_02_FULL_50_12]
MSPISDFSYQGESAHTAVLVMTKKSIEPASATRARRGAAGRFFKRTPINPTHKKEIYTLAKSRRS